MYLIRSSGEDRPASLLTVLAVSAQTIAVIGPTLGGLLITVGGWRTLFAINVPLAVLCLVFGLLRLPRTAPAARGRVRLDLLGIALFTAMLTALLLFLMHLTRWPLVVVAVAAGAALTVRELRVAEPFIDLRVLGGNVALLATYTRTLLTYTVGYAFIYGFTQWLEAGRGLNPSVTGLVMLPIFLTAIGVSALTGRRQEVRGKLLVGGVAQAAASGLLLVLDPGSAIWLLAGVALVVGVPQGLLGLANQNALYHQADPTRIGASSGLLRTFMYLGAIVASAANGVFFADGADTAGLHHLAVFLLVVAGVQLAVTLADRSLGRIVSSKGTS